MCGGYKKFMSGLTNNKKGVLILLNYNFQHEIGNSNIKQNIEELDNEMAIICGDWNLIIDPELDCENNQHVNNP